MSILFIGLFPAPNIVPVVWQDLNKYLCMTCHISKVTFFVRGQSGRLYPVTLEKTRFLW